MNNLKGDNEDATAAIATDAVLLNIEMPEVIAPNETLDKVLKAKDLPMVVSLAEIKAVPQYNKQIEVQKALPPNFETTHF